jgi:trk/ktr system potassium uptake protein
VALFPSILEEIGPENADFLFCFTDNDQDNIIASLVSRKMDFGRVITRIHNPDFETICKHKRARHTTGLIGDLYFFKFLFTESTEKKLEVLDLPKDTQIVCVFRGDEAYLVSNLEMLKEDDVATLIAKQKQVEAFSAKFELPRQFKSKNNSK